ncbi:MAG: AAA domain-containing protein, partial [Vicinamibacterales bacterium]
MYFPLPTNDEQLRIVQKASGTPGVVVQGPPGTGKSHTIANLISHYLAEGRRVLVTAQTAQALRVLRDKMPAELQELCITLLGDSRASDRDLRRSVNGILHRRQDFNQRAYELRIGQLENNLLASRTKLNQLEQTLHQARAAETDSLEPEVGYRGTRAAIARTLRKEQEQFGWVKDRIPHRSPVPTHPDGWEELTKYHASLTADLRARLAPDVVAVPFSDADARAAVQSVLTARHNLAANPGSSRAATLPADLSSADLAAATEWLAALAHAETGVTDADTVWTRALRKVLLRNTSQWEALRAECRSALQPLTEEVVAATVKVEVSGRTQAEAKVALIRLEKHYAEGGQRRNLLGMRPAVVKENDWVEQAVAVEGAPVRSPEDITRARKALEGWALLETAWAPWEDWGRTTAKTPRAQVSALQARGALLHLFLDVAAKAQPASIPLRQWLVLSLDSEVQTTELVAAIWRRRCEIALADALGHLSQMVMSLRRAIGSLTAVPSLLAIAAAMSSEDLDALARAQAELKEEVQIREEYRRYQVFLASCRKAAPLLAAYIVAAEGTTMCADKFARFIDAWRHHGVRDWLDAILSSERIEAMHRAARDERARQQEILADLTSAKAWLAALLRIDDRQRAVLTGWEQAVRAIPASGPNVFRKRANAQRLLAGCLSSIPAWVVSLSRLYETVDPEPGLFDVAIVDEASQCWLDSLVLFYLAKQVIIVGDDKQIAPTVVGVAEEEIDALARTYLPDFQFRSSFTLTSSLFDHGRQYLSDAVPLREHFRCVPEIITFSSRLCYAERPLIPLRQVGTNRLEPLKRTYVPDGLRDKDINDVEAKAIVDAIAACHEDPAYEGAEFGVICLQGEDQGEHIEHLLVERLGTEAYAERNLRCGNPYVFQGDERDVMFLSMVVASNQRHAALTTSMYEQRFNVAMSRARDQAWLFHSVQEDELGANCLRRRVLEYFKNPPVDTISGTTLDVHQLRLHSERADRMEERAPKPFDSWFEVDVALALAARGYRLSAQVQVATKFIDLVVEGEEGLRLAVECDGEAWHGADRYAEDVARQRQLERAGWVFVRVRESLFYSNETAAVREVVAACEELDIFPAGVSKPRPTAPTPPPPPRPEPSPVDEAEQRGHEAEEHIQPESESDHPDPQRGREEPSDPEEPETIPPENIEYPDPRTATPDNVRTAVLDIVTRYGPLTKALIYEQYRDGCPKVARAAKNLRHAVNSALTKLERAGKVESRDEGTRRVVADVLFRMPEQAWVKPR